MSEHSHHHHHHHHKHPHVYNFNKSFAISVALHITFTFIEAVYALIANSMSLLSDAGHNLGDLFGLLLAWGASWLMTRPPSEQYSYGYKRTTILAALSNSLLLIATSVFIIFGSIENLLHPKPINEHIIIWVALVGIFVNAGAALLFRKDQQHDLNIKGAYIHLLSDAAISLGVVITGIFIYYTKILWLDPIVSLVIVVAILFSTWELLRDSVNLFLDAVPHKVNQRAVIEYLKQFPGVSSIHDLHIWGLSTQEIALTAHLIMPEKYLTDEDYQTIYHKLKTDFHIDHVTLQVELSKSNNPCGQVTRC